MITFNNTSNLVMGHIYLVPKRGESDADYIKRVGIVTAQKYLKPAAIEAATSSLRESGYSTSMLDGTSSLITGVGSAATDYITSGNTGSALKAGATAGAIDYAKKYATKELASRVASEGAKKAGELAFQKAIEKGATEAAAKTAGNAAITSASGAAPVVGGVVGGIMGALGGKDDRSRATGAMSGAITGAISSTGAGAVAVAAMEAAKAIGKNISSNKGANARVGATYDPERGLTFLRSDSGKGGESAKMLSNLPKSVRDSLERELKAATDSRVNSVEGMSDDVIRALGREYFSPEIRVEGRDIAEWGNSGEYFVTENMKKNMGYYNDKLNYSSLTDNDLGTAQKLAAHNIQHGTGYTVRDFMTAQGDDSHGSEDIYNIGTSQANILDVGKSSRSITQGVEGRDARGPATALRGTGDSMDQYDGPNPWA